VYQKIVRPVLFKLDPEWVHLATIQLMRAVGCSAFTRKLCNQIFNAYSHYNTADKQNHQKIFNLTFPNPIGLAAGYDKDGLAWKGLTTLGFGHIEVGTVTPKPQKGNPKPRIFRIPEEQAIINRMGFPGKGADFLASRLADKHDLKSQIIIGVNIGKNKTTPNEEAARDYLTLLDTFAPLADYLAVNISSPNTIGLRRLQGRDYLEKLLSELAKKRATYAKTIPILVKLAPDLDDNELDDALDAITNTGMEGVIATNTTISRKNLQSELKNQVGGLSGAPLRDMSRNMVLAIHRRTAGRLPIVGVGGIMTPDDAKRMMDSGASLIQIYTGLIYSGPGLVRRILSSC
jgi:dihydroorotate dehydrogenase